MGLLLIMRVCRYGDMSDGVGICGDIFTCIDIFVYHCQYSTMSGCVWGIGFGLCGVVLLALL